MFLKSEALGSCFTPSCHVRDNKEIPEFPLHKAPHCCVLHTMFDVFIFLHMILIYEKSPDS